MNAYSQLSDAELVRKVLELMGYKFNAQGKAYTLERDDIATDMKYEYLIDAPNPLTDANVTMGLVDEMRLLGKRINIQADKDGYVVYLRNTSVYDVSMIYGDNPARAICEVYCMVKEGK